MPPSERGYPVCETAVHALCMQQTREADTDLMAPPQKELEPWLELGQAVPKSLVGWCRMNRLVKVAYVSFLIVSTPKRFDQDLLDAMRHRFF